MLVTNSDEPPPITAMRCVPTTWVVRHSSAERMWSRSRGADGREMSIWSNGSQLKTLLGVASSAAPSRNELVQLKEERWFARPDELVHIVGFTQAS
eukprot:6068890-Pleurochrysis_carterae.AAC.1